MSKPVTNVPATQQAPSDVALTPADLALMAEGAATGVESFTLKQTIVPFLFIVQGASDYVKRGQAKFIDVAREGDIMDSLLLRPTAEAFIVICKYEDHSTEWRPNQGGIVAQYFTDHSKYYASAKKGAGDFDGMTRLTAEGNDVTLVPTYYCLLVNPETGRGRPVVLPMAGTQAKKSRRINGLIDALTFAGADGTEQTAPIYSQVFKLTTVPEQNKDGKSFAGWRVDPAGLTLKFPGGRNIWAHAQEVRKQVEQGVMRSAPPIDITSETSVTTRAPRRDGATRTTDTDEIPF